jgi:hypothetical protein
MWYLTHSIGQSKLQRQSGFKESKKMDSISLWEELQKTVAIIWKKEGDADWDAKL